MWNIFDYVNTQLIYMCTVFLPVSSNKIVALLISFSLKILVVLVSTHSNTLLSMVTLSSSC